MPCRTRRSSPCSSSGWFRWSDTGSRPVESVATVEPCPVATGSATAGPALLDSSGRTLDALAKTPSGAGFADLDLCRRTDEILLWWKGDVPTEAQAQIDALPLRVVLRVAPRPGSWRQSRPAAKTTKTSGSAVAFRSSRGPAAQVALAWSSPCPGHRPLPPSSPTDSVETRRSKSWRRRCRTPGPADRFAGD